MQDKVQSVIVNENTNDLFFHAQRLCQYLGLSDYKKVLRERAKEKDIFYLKDLLTDKNLYKKDDAMTMYLSEGMFYHLVLLGETREAEEIKQWVFGDLTKTLLKTGEYTASNSQRNRLNDLIKKFQHYGDNSSDGSDDAVIQTGGKENDIKSIYLMYKKQYMELKDRYLSNDCSQII